MVIIHPTMLCNAAQVYLSDYNEVTCLDETADLIAVQYGCFREAVAKALRPALLQGV